MTRGASRDRRAVATLRRVPRFAPFQRHRYESRFSLERVKRGRAFRRSSARGACRTPRADAYDLFRRATTPNATTSGLRARPSGGPLSFGRPRRATRRRGRSFAASLAKFLQTRVATPRPSRSERGTRRVRTRRRRAPVRFRADHAFDFRARARHVHEHAQPPRFSLGSSVRVNRRRGNSDADAPETRRPTRRRGGDASVDHPVGRRLAPSHHSRHPSG